MSIISFDHKAAVLEVDPHPTACNFSLSVPSFDLLYIIYIDLKPMVIWVERSELERVVVEVIAGGRFIKPEGYVLGLSDLVSFRVK